MNPKSKHGNILYTLLGSLTLLDLANYGDVVNRLNKLFATISDTKEKKSYLIECKEIIMESENGIYTAVADDPTATSYVEAVPYGLKKILDWLDIELDKTINASIYNPELICLKSGLDTETLLSTIYKELKGSKLSDSYEAFERHFIEGDTEYSWLHWLGTEAEIAHLFSWLATEPVIITDSQNELIAEHFLNKKGDSFKPGNLSVARSKTILDAHPIILNLVSKLE